MRLTDYLQRTSVSVVRDAAEPLTSEDDIAPVLDEVRDAELVLLGEATHGTHEFYHFRARLTEALIRECGFAAVAIEGDWPDAQRVNRYVRHEGADLDSAGALGGFARFPIWMWRNTAITRFVAWLREHNSGLPLERRVGFHGLDLYSLEASARAVVSYLERTAPELAPAARASYGCFEQFGSVTDDYAWAAARLGAETCEDAVTRELLRLHDERARLEAAAGPHAFFDAEQNARLAVNAERYYRTMFQGRVASWNLRDRHMHETLESLRRHLRRHGREPKIVVWAHNSHLGDARATQAARSGELNLGQLVREQHGRAARLVGFTTHAGTVIAASDWGEPAELKQVRPALAGSVEEVFHRTGVPVFYLPFRPGSPVAEFLDEPRLERAIGVIYRPETERQSHYFEARLARQFDAVVHFDVTRALQPLEQIAAWEGRDAPETFPSGV